MNSDAFYHQYCKREEKKISVEVHQKEKSQDLFDQFISYAEHDIVSRPYGSFCLVVLMFILNLNCVNSVFV